MEKKLKYLLGAGIIGLGLLINQSFAFFSKDLHVEAVTLPFNESSFSSSSNYLYNFNNQNGRISYQGNDYNWLVYSLYYDGETKFNYTLSCSNGGDCPVYTFNDSAFDTGSFYNSWRTYSNINYFDNQAGAYTPIKFAFGKGSDKGKAFIYTNYLEPGQTSPKFAFGNGFFDYGDYSSVSFGDNSSLNFLRLFYNQNVNLSSPMDGYDHTYATGSNMLYNSGVIAFMEMTQNSNKYQTNYNSDVKYLVDYGSQGTKGLTFGGYGVGYSYAVNFSTDYNTLLWGNWSFGNVGSVCGLSAMQLGYTSFEQITQNNCANLGLLTLKGDSYVSRGNNASVIVLGKNPNNYKQILYQQFDCAQDDVLRVMSDQFCTPIGHGYITYNGSGDILPFEGTGDSYTLGGGNTFLDFLFNQGIYGNVSIDLNNSQYCLNSNGSQFCFGLHATPNDKSLKEMYLEAGGDIAGNGGTVSGSGLDDIILFQPEDYYTYSGLIEYVMSGYDDSVGYIDGYADNYLDYVLINGVPQLKDLKFGVCPFKTDPNLPTYGFKHFSFDFLKPHKCIISAIQVGLTSVNSSGLSLGLDHKLIPDSDNENVTLISHFVAIIFIIGIYYLLFYFIKKF